MDISELLSELKTKYNYDDDLLNLLGPIITNMISYFGEEYSSIITNAILETPIGFVENREDINNFAHSLGVKKDYSIPTFASAAYEEYFQLDENNNIQRIPFIIIRSNYDKDKPDQRLGTIVHELCHMVMNYGKSRIEGNRVYSKTGLIEEEIIVTPDGKISNDENTPIEEGLNEYDARMITQMILGRTYETTTYNTYYMYVSPVMNNEELRHAIDISRLNGDNSWMELMGEELSIEFMESFNNYISSALSFKATDEEREAYKNKSVETFNKMKELMQNYNNEHTITR